MRWITRSGLKAGSGEDDPGVLEVTAQALKGMVRDVGTGIIPADHQAPVVHEVPQLGADKPALISERLAAKLPSGTLPRHGWRSSMPEESATPSRVGSARKRSAQAAGVAKSRNQRGRCGNAGNQAWESWTRQR
jgi:hypothetical protein